MLRHPRARLHGLPILPILLAGLALLAAAPASAGQLDLQFGGHIPFEPEERQQFDASPWFGIGLSGQMGRSQLHPFIEAGWLLVRQHSDDVFHVSDFPSAITYDLVPVTIGMRVDLNRKPVVRSPTRLFFGAGFQTILVHATAPDGTTEDVPTYGAILEIRPEYRAPGGVTLWISQRVNVMAAAAFDLFPDLELNGAMLSGGLGFWW